MANLSHASLKDSHVRDFPKPVLSKGLLAFVRHKELKVGDRVKSFKEKDQSGPGTTGLKLKRKSRYLGLSLRIITMDQSADTILTSIRSVSYMPPRISLLPHHSLYHC
ncbi:hypothetical protein NC651_028149 [Populus alba x Populus x berolinensis]|nr:hypothetical protein NC651_028149 [Populus alba x Populus x berolinensis]